MKFNFKSISGLMLVISLLLPSLGLVSCSDDDDKFVPDGPVTLSVTRDGEDLTDLDFGTYGGSMIVALETNAYWNISVSGEGADWLVLSNRSGDPTIKNLPDREDEPRYIKISAAAIGKNPTRSCTVTFRAANEVKTVTVTQKQLAPADEAGWESAYIACQNMTVGCNLFNTLDAVGTWFDPDDIVTCETCWGQPLATQEWFNAVYANGFRVVRVPVTWWLHMDENWKVKEPWMARVEEVVNYALNAGLYCILNVHHDTGANDGKDSKNKSGWLRADLDNIDEISVKFESLWLQIANRFNKYGEKLLFEGYNEMLDAQDSWLEPVAGGYEAINIYAQKFVNTVRSTGGNNAHRNLIVNTYGAGGSRTRLDNFVIPEDEIGGHLLLEVHNYSPSKFTNLNGEIDDDHLPVWTAEFESQLAEELDLLIEYSNSNNIPIVVGECGCYDKIADVEKAKYGEFLTSYPKGKADIVLIHWGGMIDRTTYEKMSPLYVDGFIRGAQ